MIFYDQNKEHVLKSLHSSQDGLSTEQATQRLHQFGYNIINIKGESWIKKILEPFRSIFIAILALAAILSIFKDEPLDAAIIITIIMISAIIYYVQSFSTERVLKALKKHDKQIVRVWRDGKTIQLDSEVLVPGDVIELTEGEKVPTDCRVLHSENCRVDEALLTGESEPVAKHNAPLQSNRPIYEQTNMLFQGSFVVSGNVKAVVVETGNTTEFGRLAQLAGNTHIVSPVQQKIDKLISVIVGTVAVVSILVFILNLMRGYDASEALRFMIALAVSAVPEGLPIAISVILVLGMHRMAKKNALVRSMSAIENVGLVTMIATDKTGTLTKNKLSIQDVWELKPKSDLHDAAGFIHRSIVHNQSGTSYDPLDEAFMAFAHEYNAESDKDEELIKVLPFDLKHAMSGALWKRKSDKIYGAYIKGAPEKILAASSCSSTQIKTIEKELHHLTGQGLRVIALGYAKYHQPINDFDEALSHKLEFIALIAVADELREEAPAAIRAAQQAGIEVTMITGDHAETAYAIGKQIGLLHNRAEVFDSRKLDSNHQDHDNLSNHVYSSKVFARVTPENKYKLLTLFKQKHITAMTGDGVNDVPALAQSHIGFAMGSGTQIAKEAGDIVLLDDNFSTIVSAIKEGRTIFANIRRMLFYLLATTTGAVLTMLGALIIGLPLPALAVQILWINLVTDTALVIPLGLEPAEADVMKTSPRKPTQPILDRYMLWRIIIVAVTMAVSVLIVFVYFLQDNSESYARTISFTVLVALQWANAFNARSDIQSALARLKVPNVAFAIGLTISVLLQILALFGPLSGALHVVPVDMSQLVISCLIACAAVIIVAEVHKFWCRSNQTSLS